MRTAWGIVVAIVSVVVLVGCTSTASAPSGDSLQDRLVADVTGAGAYTHLEVLQRIADENGGSRASPGPGYDASVDYVVRVLHDAGYQVSTPTSAWTTPTSGM